MMSAVAVCLSVCFFARLSLEAHVHTSQNFLHSFVILRRRCDTLCTFGFVDDVVFTHKRQQATRKGVYSK